MTKLAVIIPAAGSGSRMGSRIPKPFLKLRDITILEHTIRSFAELSIVSQIIVATSGDWKEEVQSILNRFSGQVDHVMVVDGGKERQDSINNALSALSENVDLVAVHDAVRPFISHSLIQACAEKALEFGGAIIAVPAKDTIKEVESNDTIQRTPDRNRLWQAQTPQVFKKALLIEAYQRATKDKFVGTDDSSLVERIGGVVKVVEGDRKNLKITYPVDLKVAELIIDQEEL